METSTNQHRYTTTIIQLNPAHQRFKNDVDDEIHKKIIAAHTASGNQHVQKLEMSTLLNSLPNKANTHFNNYRKTSIISKGKEKRNIYKRTVVLPIVYITGRCYTEMNVMECPP